MEKRGHAMTEASSDPAPGLVDRLWPALTILAGIAIYYGLFNLLFNGFTPSSQAMARPRIFFLWEGEGAIPAGAVLDRDLAARYRFALSSVGLVLTGITAIIVALTIVLRPFRWHHLGLVAFGGGLGGVIGYVEQWSNRLRTVAADCRPEDAGALCPLNEAVKRSVDGFPMTAEALEHIRLVVSINSTLGVAASGVLIMVFAILATPPGEGRLSPPRLRKRRQGFVITLVLSAILLSFSVATTHSFYNLAAALVRQPAADQIAGIASSAATYWGAVFTAITIVTAAPCAASIYLDVGRAAETGGGSYHQRREWIAAEGLTFDPLRGFGAILIAAGRCSPRRRWIS